MELPSFVALKKCGEIGMQEYFYAVYHSRRSLPKNYQYQNLLKLFKILFGMQKKNFGTRVSRELRFLLFSNCWDVF